MIFINCQQQHNSLMMEVKYVCWMDVCLHSNQTSTNAWTPSVCPLHAAKGIRPYIQGYQFSRCRLIYSCVRWQINMGPCGQRCNSLRRHAEGLIGEERECWDFISHLTTLLPSLLKFQGTNVKKKKKKRQTAKFPHHPLQRSDKALFKYLGCVCDRTGSVSGSQEG